MLKKIAKAVLGVVAFVLFIVVMVFGVLPHVGFI